MGRERVEWMTVDVESIRGGWFNVYREDSETWWVPCPAVLVQREAVVRGVDPEPVTIDPSGRSRAVFAATVDGELVPACDLPGYVETVGPHGAPPGSPHDRYELKARPGGYVRWTG